MNPLNLPRFAVTYRIGPRSYWFAIPAPNAAHIWRSWDRPGAKLVSVVEVDENGSEI
jgi:hypothetical protein